MRVLIYWPEIDLKPTGGPSGYLCNIKEFLQKDEDIDFSFLQTESFFNTKASSIPIALRRLLSAMKWASFYKNCKELKIEGLSSYDAIHFHRTIDLYRCKTELEGYRGKVVLTSHTPSASFVEIVSGIAPVYQTIFKKGLALLKKVDEYAFDQADTLIFPCESALEPYAHTWANFDEVYERNANKFCYVPTGIQPCHLKRNPNEVRKEYSIPDDAFVLAYVGRHNAVKGYDSLVKAGRAILDRFPNVYVLVAGKEEPFKGLKDPRWIEVGWTNAPHDLIGASDAFVLPNKETYFDLILLEVLSLGKPVILTNTGGNKYFKQFETNDLFYYKEEEELISQLDVLVNRRNRDKKLLVSENNKQIFLKNFTADIFFEQYKKTMLEL